MRSFQNKHAKTCWNTLQTNTLQCCPERWQRLITRERIRSSKDVQVCKVAHVTKLAKKSSDNGPAETIIPINSTLPVSTPQTPTEPRPVRQRNSAFRYKDYILV